MDLTVGSGWSYFSCSWVVTVVTYQVSWLPRQLSLLTRQHEAPRLKCIRMLLSPGRPTWAICGLKLMTSIPVQELACVSEWADRICSSRHNQAPLSFPTAFSGLPILTGTHHFTSVIPVTSAGEPRFCVRHMLRSHRHSFPFSHFIMAVIHRRSSDCLLFILL